LDILIINVMRGNLAKGSDSRMDVGVYKMDVKWNINGPKSSDSTGFAMK
jgi:hypothetical protein